MARIKTSSLLAEIRGNLGGVVFSSNGNGFYCKQFKAPTQPRTAAQVLRRSRFADCAHGFSSMAPASVGAWVTYAADPTNTRYNYFGDAYLPNAYNQFIGVNMLRQAAGLAISYTPPVSAIPASLPNMSVFIDFQPAGPNSTITNLAAFDASCAYIHISMRLWANLGRTQPPLPLYFFLIPAVGSFPALDIQADLISRFGDLPTDGNWYVVLTPVTNDFRLGPEKVYTGRSGDTVTG